MGKAGRVACIFTPWAMTVVSLVFMVLIELGGWNSGDSLLNSLYGMQADFRNLTTTSASSGGIAALLQQAKQNNQLSGVYQIHISNYCTSNSTSGIIDSCTDRQTDFYFDPITVWHLNASASSTTTTKMLRARDNPITTAEKSIDSAVSNAEDNLQSLEEQFLGKTATSALDAYRKAAKWMYISFQVALWTTLATILVAIFAVFSRWGSFLTWLFAIASSLFSFAASLTATILFATLVGTLKAVLDPYNVQVTVGDKFLVYTWIGTAFSIGATSFWLFSVCCCSGKSNPHHRGNKGGLWKSEPKMGYDDGRGRGLRVEKTGGYERVASPYMGSHAHQDHVPLADYPQPQGYAQGMHPGEAYEPYRHQL